MNSVKALILAILFSLTALPAGAGMIGTDQLRSAPGKATATDFAAERRSIVRQLIEHGVEPAEAARRVERLTDRQIASLEQRIDEMPAGGMSATELLLILIILLLVL